MYHVDNSTGVPVMPQPSPVTSETELFFTEGGNGVPPTFPGPDWFNIIQSELINILRAAGLDPDKMDNTQILAALKKLFLSRSNPFGDIKADGAAAIATALSNLRLERFVQLSNATRINSPNGKLYLWINNAAWGVYDDESAKNIPLGVDCGGTGSTTASGAQDNLGISSGIFPIGMPFFWPSSSSPAEIFPEFSGQVFLKWNGASFSATEYPKLAKVIPGLRLTEARGEFPRIWDDGRGVDSGRTLLSAQGDAIRNITGVLRGGSYKTDSISDGDTGPFSVQSRGVITGLYDSGGANGYTYIDHKFEAGSVVPTASENRPRNIAFNFLVRAK